MTTAKSEESHRATALQGQPAPGIRRAKLQITRGSGMDASHEQARMLNF